MPNHNRKANFGERSKEFAGSLVVVGVCRTNAQWRNVNDGQTLRHEPNLYQPANPYRVSHISGALSPI